MNTRATLKINEKGHLEIGGADAVDLAKSFGTPLYVLDEQYMRDMCAIYRDTIQSEDVYKRQVSCWRSRQICPM